MDLSQAQTLLADTKTLMRGVNDFEQAEESAWAIVFQTDLLIEVQFNADTEKLLIVADLGTPAEANRSQVCEMLLSFNYLHEETNGVLMALDAPDGRAVQMVSLEADKLEANQLALALENFAAKAETWRELIHAAPHDNRPDETNSIHDALRV